MRDRAAYDRLMERAKGRRLSGYSERHHAEPLCVGGANVPENVVRLTPEEHYVAHQLLTRMYPDHRGLAWAAVNMTNGVGGRQNKLYGWVRRHHAETMRKWNMGHPVSEESRAKMRAAKLGKKRGPHTGETKAKMSAASRGRPKSAAHRQAMSMAKMGRKTGPHHETWKRNQSKAIRRAFASGASIGDHWSPDYRNGQANRMIEIWQRRHAGKLPMPQYKSPAGG